MSNLKSVVEDFAKEREFEQVLYDREGFSVTLVDSLDLVATQGQMIVELDADERVLDTFIHYDLECKDAVRREVIELIHEIHQRWSFGRFELLSNGGLRWCYRLDTVGLEISVDALKQITGTGYYAASMFSLAIDEIVNQGRATEDVMRDFDEANEKARREADGIRASMR